MRAQSVYLRMRRSIVAPAILIGRGIWTVALAWIVTPHRSPLLAIECRPDCGFSLHLGITCAPYMVQSTVGAPLFDIVQPCVLASTNKVCEESEVKKSNEARSYAAYHTTSHRWKDF